MALSTPAGVKIEYDDSGGVLRDISQYVQTFNGIEIEDLNVENSGFSAAYEKNTPIGKARIAPVVLSGDWDDVANGPEAVFKRSAPESPSSTKRTLTITFRTGVTFTMETWRGKYARRPKRDGLTQYEVTLLHDGAVPVEAP